MVPKPWGRPALLAVMLLLGLQGLLAASSLPVQPAAVLAASALQQPLAGAASSTQQQVDGASTAAATQAGEGEGVLPGDPDPAADAMIDWLHRNGGEVNVAIRRNVPGAGRSTFAPRAFKKGDVLARFPVEMAYVISDQDESLAMSATYLVADMAEADSPWAPYFNALPAPADVWSTSHVPKSYLPIIQDEYMETSIQHLQENAANLWEQYGERYRAVLGPDVSPANLTHAMGLLLSRLFRFDGTDVLLPVVDFANHHNECHHSHLPEPCDPEEGYLQWKEDRPSPKVAPTAGSGVFGPEALIQAHSSSSSSNGSSNGMEGVMSGQCFVWRAETELQPGDAVCNSYKTLLQDRSALQYGFLQSGWPAEQLNTLDRHERVHSLDAVWDDPPELEYHFKHGPRRFEGTPVQIHNEIARLTARLAMLRGNDAVVAAITPDPAVDPDGRRLAFMREWHRQRLAAIEAEIPRLQRQALRMEKWELVWQEHTAAAKPAGAGAEDKELSLDRINSQLIQWLEQNGAKIDVELQLLPAKQQQACTSDGSSSSQQTCAAPADASTTTAAAAAGVFTRRAVKKGDTMAVIPVQLGYPVKPGAEKLESAVDLMTDLLDALDNKQSSSSSSTPANAAAASASGSKAAGASRSFMLSLPPLGSVRSLCNFPPEYLPLIHQPRAEAHIRQLQQLTRMFEERRPEIEARDNSTTVAELQHAASLLVTRPLLPVAPLDSNQADESAESLLLVPIFNNARHNSSCTHDYYIDACPGGGGSSSSSSSSSSSLCFFWVAGADLPAGGEVCVSYGHLRPDQALLMYGLPVDTPDLSSSSGGGINGSSVPLWMSGLDSIEATAEEPFAPISAEPLKHWTPATREEAVAECQWLTDLHANWTGPELTANVSAVTAVPSDPSGTFLQQLLQWRQQRIAAVEAEIARLTEVYNISSSEVAARRHGLQGFGVGAVPDGSGIDTNFTSSSSDPWQRMLDWMRHNGAEIHVNVTYGGPQFGRVVTALEPMQRGDLLAAIPMDLVWNTETSGGNGSMQLAAANFWAEMDDAASPYRPYLDALPTPEEMVCPLVQLPQEYYPLLASAYGEEFVTMYRQQVMEFWETYGEDMAKRVPSITLDKFKYARGLLSTRLFGLTVGASMVPLLDLANHAPYCPNMHHEQPCPQDPTHDCIVWTAGAFVPRGAELCNGYKWMPNDRSMLQYGFLQSGPISQVLHTMDQPQVNASNMFSLLDQMQYGPEPFDGTQKELEAEIARLQVSLANLTATDAAAAAAAPAATDKGGRLLSMLREWRGQRKAALHREIARLQQRLAVVTGKQQQEHVAPEERLLEWLKENGGQVNGVRVGVADGAAKAKAAAKSASPAASATRGVFATRAISSGEVMAVVPLELALAVNTDNLLADAPTIHSELVKNLSTRAPYYATFPDPSEVFSFYELPLEYAAVVQHPQTEEFIIKSSAALEDFASDNHEEMATRSMNLTQLKHAFSLVATRLIHFKEGGHIVPLVDMANHQNGCRHFLSLEPCDHTPAETTTSSSSGGSQGGINTTQVCVLWKAGADIAAGEEVCLLYGYLLPDRAMLQYGYIPQELLPALEKQQQAQQVPVPLFGIDRHDFSEWTVNGDLPWNYWLDYDVAPAPFTGTPDETAAEVSRLRALLQELFAGDAAAAAVQPVPEVDPRGEVLRQLRQLRELRKVAVAQEIARLNLQIDEMQEQQRDEL